MAHKKKKNTNNDPVKKTGSPATGKPEGKASAAEKPEEKAPAAGKPEGKAPAVGKPEEKAPAAEKTEEQAPEAEKEQVDTPALPAKPQKKKKESELWKRAKVTTKLFLHVTKLFFLIVLGLLVLAGIILSIVHAAKKKSESQYLVMKGEQVEVDGRYLHVIKGGPEGADQTLVFLHGDRITDDSVVLQPVFRKIEDQTAYFYVDRSGAGFSDATDGGERDVDSLVEETRKAASAAGVKAPYILVAEGTSGIMALHWAHKYPEEVKGIFGLGFIYPEQFDGVKPGDYVGFGDWITLQFFRIGGVRLFSSMKPTNPAGIFTEDEMNTRSALVNKGAFTKDMYNEDKAMVDGANLAREEGWPDVPIFLLYGNPLMAPYIVEDEDLLRKLTNAVAANPDEDFVGEFYEEERNFFAQKKNVEMKEISGPVRITIYASDEIAKELLNFVKNVQSKQN